MLRFKIKGKMTSHPHTPRTDMAANAIMKRKGIKQGIYYVNEGEDAGSISAVVPSVEHLEQINNLLKNLLTSTQSSKSFKIRLKGVKKVGSHGKSMTQANKQNRTDALSQETERVKATPESLAMFTHSLQKSEDKTRVASIVVCSGDKMLMLQRRDNNKWTFPSGHLNDDESFINGAVRELWEEAGIRANPDELILLGDEQTFEGKTIHVYLYKVNSEAATTASNDPDKEAKQFKWLPHILPEEIKENLHIPVEDNASLSIFMKYLMSRKSM